MKEGVYIATTSAAAELCDSHDAPCYTMLCRYKSFPNAPMSCTMHLAVTNLLQEIDNRMESRTTPIQEGEDDEDITASDTYTFKSQSSSTWTSFSSRILETVCTKSVATATYGVRLRRSLYSWKHNFITFPTPPDSDPQHLGGNDNSGNKSTTRIYQGVVPPLLGQ